MPEPANNAETLQGLANALLTLAKRMRTRESAAQDFARLVSRADGIAGKARLLQTSKWGLAENAVTIADDLAAFAQDVAAAAARAAAEMSGNTAITDALIEHANRIGQIARGVETSPGSARIASELRPLETTLNALHVRMQRESTLSEDASRLARQAAGLADAALAFRTNGGVVTHAAEIHTALRGFVDEAGAIATRMSKASSGLREAAAGMALQTAELSTKAVTKAVTW